MWTDRNILATPTKSYSQDSLPGINMVIQNSSITSKGQRTVPWGHEAII